MPTNGKAYDVFLSHNSADKPVVEMLARRLVDESHLSPFLDKWHLVPGNPWQEDLEQALDRSATCAVFVGPKGIGPWHNEEMRSALDERVGHPGFRVVPVLLPGATLPERSQLPRCLRRLTWVDFRGPLGLNDAWAFQRLVAGIRGVPPGRDGMGTTGAAITECPYRGLEVFDEAHTLFFFGREADTQQLVEALHSTRFLAVVGPSGSGKSSLVRAGLLPELRRGALPRSDQWRYCVFKPGAHPLEELAVSLAQTMQRADVQSLLKSLESDERELHLQVRLLLHRQPDAMRVCLVVDQFEELFTLCQDPTERQQFIKALRYAATVVGGQTVVLPTLRADFIARAVEHAVLAELLSGHQFLVGPMEAEDLVRVMEEPARLVGARLEAGLADRMLQDTGHEPGILPLLQHTLLQLWVRRRPDNVLTFAAYADTGGVQGALAKHADAVFVKLSPAEQSLARRMLLRLTQPGEGTEDTRRRATFSELQTQEAERHAVETVVKTLTDARLLVTSGDQQKDEIDLAHEALIRGWPRLRGWIGEERSALRTHRRIMEAAKEWQHLGRDEGVLFRGALLLVAQEWREQHEADLNEWERQFLDASLKLQVSEKEKERDHEIMVKWSIWVQWILANTTCGVVMLPIGWPVSWAVVGFVTGAAVGVAQWLVLKRQFYRAGWWVLTTAVGGAGGGVLVWGASLAQRWLLTGVDNIIANRGVSWAVVGFVTGAVVGVAQWLVLKRQFYRAGWWVLTTAIGGAGGGIVSESIGWVLGWAMSGELGWATGWATGGIVGEAIGWALAGAVYGAATGPVLVWLLRRPILKT